MLPIGTVVERYRIEALLGQGGMAAVYRVRHESLNTLHALKVLSIDSKSVRARLLQEGQVQAGLRHPNIVEVRDVLDVLDVSGAPGLLMEYVEGVAMDAWLDAHKPTVDEALAIFRGVLAGIGHAHAEGLIHRDLKPANIMLAVGESEIVPKIADFGLAKLTLEPGQRHTRTGTTMGTPEYMPPEQIRDASSVDRRADLYALGCILYELFCGQTPFSDDDLLELFAKVRSGAYPPPEEVNPDIPPEVARCIRNLVQTDPANRIADCASILEILDGGDAPPSGDTLARARRVQGSDSHVSIHSPGGEVAVRLTAEHQRATEVPAPQRRPVTSGETVAQSLFTEPLPPTTEAPLPPRTLPDAAPPPPVPPAQTSRRGLGVVLIAAVFALLALALIAIPVAVWGLVALREPTVALPAPVEPEPQPEVTPDPEPEPVPPEPEPVPEPPPVEPPAPVVPADPPPTPTPTAPSPVAPGQFAVTGARSAWLTVKGRKRRPGDAVTPGSWPLTVTLDGVPTALPMADVEIRSGETTRIACLAKMKLCRQEN